MTKPPLSGVELDDPSYSAKMIIGGVVFALGVLAGAGIAIWDAKCRHRLCRR
jgi:hypothetical protein